MRSHSNAAQGGITPADRADPANPANDHLVFSKGHASPLYYSILKAAGSIDDLHAST